MRHLEPAVASGLWNRLLLLILSLYCVFIAVIVLLPTGTLPSAVITRVVELVAAAGAPPLIVDRARIEFALNVVMIAFISAVGSQLWSRWNWRDWTTAVFVVSISIEITQGLLLPDRSATFVDVGANTLGGLLGALIGTIWPLHARHRRGAVS